VNKDVSLRQRLEEVAQLLTSERADLETGLYELDPSPVCAEIVRMIGETGRTARIATDNTR
jgi:hypothetical protein